MSQVVAIAIGGAVGSVLRFWMASSVYALIGRAFPYGTLAVNVLGSLAIGFLFVLFLERVTPDGALRAGILIGLIGGFTTFSTFSIETFNLLEGGEWLKAGINVIASVVFCLGATWLGVLLGRQL